MNRFSARLSVSRAEQLNRCLSTRAFSGSRKRETRIVMEPPPRFRIGADSGRVFRFVETQSSSRYGFGFRAFCLVGGAPGDMPDKRRTSLDPKSGQAILDLRGFHF